MQEKQTYFALALAGLLLLGFLATSVASYFVAADSFSERIAEESLPLTSDNVYSEIERDLLRSILISSLMAHDTFVLDWALGGEQGPERMTRYLARIQRKYDTTTAFFVSAATRKYYHPDGVLRTVDPEEPGDVWFFRVLEMNEPYEINIDFDTADRSRLSIFVNYRVTDYQGNCIGATGIGLSVSTVSALIESYQRRYVRQIYFIDREGDVTVRGRGYQGADRIQEQPGLRRFATRLLTNPSASLSYQRPDGETVFVNSRLVPELDWYLVVEQTGSAAEHRVLNALLVNVAIALAITALVATLGWLTVRGRQRRLQEMASTDKLTGAANRHVFEALYRHVVSAARRRGDPVSMIAVDLDRFKEVNDTFGHLAGDAVLRQFAELVRANVREADTLCRWGGDEFLVLLGVCDADCAARTAEKIRAAVGAHRFLAGGREIPVTVSLGAVQHQDGEDLSALVRRADQALYGAKRDGRDRARVG